MGILVRVARFVSRALGISVVSRVGKRYPIIAVAMFAARWWSKRRTRTEREVVTLRAGETITVSDTRG